MANIEDLKQKVLNLIDEERHEEAIPIYKQILEITPSDHEAWYFLSLSYLEIDDIENAEQALKNAVDIDPENVDYLLQLGYIAQMQEKSEESSLVFERILDIYPYHPEANIMLGMIARDNGQFKEAFQYLETAYDSEPNPDVLIALIGTYLDTGDLDNAGDKIKELNEKKMNKDQDIQKEELLFRFYLDKSMENWTGVIENEDGNSEYYPETVQQLENAEHYIEMAEKLETNDEYYQNRLELIKEVIANYQEKRANLTSNEEEPELSEEDILAWKKMDEIVDLWARSSLEDGAEYRWPQTYKDVKASKKLLKKVKKIDFKNQAVEDRYNEIKETLDNAKKMIPNSTGKFLRSFLISVAAVIILLFLGTRNVYKSPKFDYNKDDWVIRETTELMYYNVQDVKNSKTPYYHTLYAGTQVEPIARWGTHLAQVKTSNGYIGFVKFKKLKGVENLTVKEDKPLYTKKELLPFYTNARKDFADSLKEGQKVRVISMTEGVESRYGDYTLVKFRTDKGKTGYLPYYNLRPDFQYSLPSLSLTFSFPTTRKNIDENVIGAQLENVEFKYGPARSLLKINNKRTAYFNQINFIDSGKKMSGVFLTLDNGNKVTGYHVARERKVKLYDKLPLAGSIRQQEPFKFLGAGFYRKNFSLKWLDNFTDLNWFTKIIGWIVRIGIGLFLLFLFFSVTRLVINPVIVLITNFRLLKNKIVLFLNFLIYASAVYIFFVWMSISIDQIFIPLIISVPTFLFWWRVYKNNITYNRCPQCNTMNVALDQGISFMGKSQKVTWGTYDVYKGTTKAYSCTKKIIKYERRSKKTIDTISHYRDHRSCIRCGFNWDVLRQEIDDSKTEYL